MARIAVVGDGPAGLSAALFLAKDGQDTVVYAQDDTLMHHAQLHNYLGAPDISGSAFQEVARRQVTEAGAQIRDVEVLGAAANSDGLDLRTPDGDEPVDYLIIAGGKSAQSLAASLGAQRADDGAIVVDQDSRTSVDRVYAAGHLVRPARSQAVISAGAGAAAALDILSREAGRDVHDWDSPSSG